MHCSVSNAFLSRSQVILTSSEACQTSSRGRSRAIPTRSLLLIKLVQTVIVFFGGYFCLRFRSGLMCLMDKLHERQNLILYLFTFDNVEKWDIHPTFFVYSLWFSCSWFCLLKKDHLFEILYMLFGIGLFFSMS